MSQDTINVLKKYLKFFENKGLYRICCKNVMAAEKEIVAVYLQLNKVNAFIYETKINVLTGLTNYSVSDFVKLFEFFLQKANTKALDNDTHEGNTLEQVKTILSKAVDAHHCLSTARKWHVSIKSSGNFNVVCCICEKEGCSIIKCVQPKEPKKIATTNKKFSEQQQNGGGTNGSKQYSSDDSSNYNENKWGAPKSGNGINLYGNKLICWCGKKDCGLNINHTTIFHNAFK